MKTCKNEDILKTNAHDLMIQNTAIRSAYDHRHKGYCPQPTNDLTVLVISAVILYL